jgi:hypothetical protein
VLAIGVLAYSIRSLFFAPFVGLALWRSFGSRRAQLAVLAALAGASVAAYRFYSVHASCPELPAYDAFLSDYRTDPGDLIRAPLVTLRRLADNLVGAGAWFSHPLFRAWYLSNWLPARPPEAMRWDAVLNLAIRAVELVWFVPAAVLGLLPLLRRGLSGVRSDARYRLGLTLVACLAASASILNYKNDYEMALALPLCLLASVLVVGAWLPSAAETRLRAGLAPWLLGSVALATVVSFGSTLYLRESFGLFAQTSWRAPGGVVGQRFSVSTVRTPDSSQLVLRAAARCGITPSPTLDRLVVDDWTLSEFWQGKQPQYVFFLNIAGFHGIHPTDFFETYRRASAPGLITQCHFLPPKVQSRAIETLGLCCLPPSGRF